MKITPIEIRQHTFEKKGFGGYRPDEVDAFLSSLSQEWERIMSENKMLKMQLELAEKELNKLKEIELTLFRTLKTAEDTSSQITDQANKAAEKYLSESRQQADEVLADARKRSTLMVQDAENQSRYIKENVLNDLKAMEHDFKAMERYKESLVTQIRTLAANAMDSVERFEKKFSQQSLQAKIDELKPEPAETPEMGTDADELPDLVDQESIAPEVIEDHLYQTTATEPAVSDPVAAQGEEAAEAGLPITEPYEEGEDGPQAVHEATEERQKVKTAESTAGSFFDQI